jgi:hypothetical protein
MRSPERWSGTTQGPSFLNGIEVLVQHLVHGKHMNLILLEHFAHGIIADDVSLVARVLQIMFAYVLPDSLDTLWPRKLRGLA